MLVLDLKTEKVIARYRFSDEAGKYEYLSFHAELFTWHHWRLILVGCRIRKTEEASSISFKVAAMKKDRITMTGFTLEDEDVKECDAVRMADTGIEKGALAFFYIFSSDTSIIKKITLNKRAVRSDSIKKLKV